MNVNTPNESLDFSNLKIVDMIRSEEELDLSEPIREAIGHNKRIKKVKSNGQCGTRAVALSALGDEAHGSEIREAINHYIVNHFEDYKKKGYSATKNKPFVRKVGNGETKVKIENNRGSKKLVVK